MQYEQPLLVYTITISGLCIELELLLQYRLGVYPLLFDEMFDHTV